jgi:hypothetical protein
MVRIEANEGSGRLRIALKITCQAAVVADPGEGAFDIQRLGRTTKRCNSLRLTISSVQVPDLAMAAAAFGP